jgi:hypothetical protein
MIPNAAQQKAKQRFWRKVRMQNTVQDINQLTDAQIARLAGDANLTNLLTDPQFHDWFLNDKAEEDLIKAGAESAIRALLDIITGVEEVKNTAVKVSAAKILLDMAGFGPKNTKEVVYKDAAIAEMSEEELKKFIEQNTREAQ